jgi:undecaprenyl-diphosphatase
MPSQLLESFLRKLDIFDRSLFFLLNGLCTWSDPFWIFWSSPWPWILMGVFFLFYAYKRLPGKAFLLAILVAGLLATATDQSANLAKKTFKRPRPCRAFPHRVHRTSARCSDYGFFSGHAANSFGQAVFWSLICTSLGRRSGSKVVVKNILLPWAFLVALSRIFTGVHYPFDVLAGALAGSFLARIFYGIFRSILTKIGIFVP